MSGVRRVTLFIAPFSVNAMWRSVNGRNIASQEYRDWKAQAANDLEDQVGIGTAMGYWRADILVPGEGTKADLDNYTKGILDALGAAGLTPDDRYLVDLRIRFSSGPHIVAAIKREDLDKWTPIRKPSSSTMRKLVRSSTSQLPGL